VRDEDAFEPVRLNRSPIAAPSAETSRPAAAPAARAATATAIRRIATIAAI
jgi:hypothetical protein